ncbi:unnamed protein product, partial [Amoebophrya sp. A25]|eukprot:GSA25T00003480001.1
MAQIKQSSRRSSRTSFISFIRQHLMKMLLVLPQLAAPERHRPPLQDNDARPPLQLHDPNRKHHGYPFDALADHILGRFLSGKEGGRRPMVFEAGAFDGESGSLSLFFERFRGFSCILMEASPIS